jgi:TM2 domain-containing membrane protein YozV
MRLFKRLCVLVLVHISLTLVLLGLEWAFPFPQLGEPIGPFTSANPLIGLGATLMTFLVVGLVWGSLVAQDDRFTGVVIGYGILLGAFLSTVWLTRFGWMGYLTLNEPLGYFVRNMTQRSVADQVALGLGLISSPLGLWIGLKSALRIHHKKRQSED